MDRVSILLENGERKEVYSIFYLYNSKYYFIYTDCEIDENGYVVLHLVQVGKETQNTASGIVDTGNMVGIEIQTPDEWKSVQESITKIVDDKKNGTQSPEIQYLPISMLTNLRIVSKKTFRLLKGIITDDFKVPIPVEPAPENSTIQPIQPVMPQPVVAPVPIDISNITAPTPLVQPTEVVPTQSNEQVSEVQPLESNSNNDINDVIIDYRASFFEEQQKNIELQAKVDELTQKIESIKNLIG